MKVLCNSSMYSAITKLYLCKDQHWSFHELVRVVNMHCRCFSRLKTHLCFTMVLYKHLNLYISCTFSVFFEFSFLFFSKWEFFLSPFRSAPSSPKNTYASISLAHETFFSICNYWNRTSVSCIFMWILIKPISSQFVPLPPEKLLPHTLQASHMQKHSQAY